MNMIEIFERFPDQQACISHLERIRWGDAPHCPHCGSVKVARKRENHLVGRWNCHGCRSSFNVISGTLLEKTKVPLQKWFLAIGLMVNAKKSLSSHQLARDLHLNQKTALYMQERLRAIMLDTDTDLLKGIVEADETYVGGKPRKGRKRDDDGDGGTPAKRGRGTDKTPVVGAVQRGGSVVAQVASNLTGKSLLGFLRLNVRQKGTTLITDEFRAYNEAKRYFENSKTINHAKAYADGETHTNTIEGFWSMLKRAWYGSHHHYTKNRMPLYVAEACWKYNHRRDPDCFGSFFEDCFMWT